MAVIDQNNVESLAKDAAGNWQRFEHFWWGRANLADAANWAIYYTSHRDSGLTQQSNAAVIALRMERFTKGTDPDVVAESHFHHMVGHIDGFSIRVYHRGQVTKAFRAWCRLKDRLEKHGRLDEKDYRLREVAATLENIDTMAWRLMRKYELPDGWDRAVYDWLRDHERRELETDGDQGGYPSEAAIERAMSALKFPRRITSDAAKSESK
jgi:hypothetical protein